ncbi:MAG: DUF4282 domain-containing protein [Acidobacteria bacterium]|jgi:hypothetical protein|nr:DUF4282 domain-containing protein [Acidobacteriota bacterium]
MINQFLTFDKLIGSKLIKILYYLGLIGIALGVIGGIFTGFAGMGYSFFAGLGTILAALIGGVLGLVFWRFMCELYMILFRMADDLRDIKNAKLGTSL